MEFASKDKEITSQFFLTGGTTLSYFYFKHRFSEDLDFFSEQEYDTKIVMNWVSKTGDKIRAEKVEQQTLTGQDVYYFYFSPKESVKVDFAYFPFSPLGKFNKFNKLRISSIEDIAINKVHALTTRNRSRDYLDLYFCMKKLSWNSSDLIKNYRLKFDVNLPIEQLATSFVKVVDSKDTPIFLGENDFNLVKDYFLSKAENLKKEIIR